MEGKKSEKFWGENGFDRRYVRHREAIFPCIGEMERLFYSLFASLVGGKSPFVCELGCGDGATMEGLLRVKPSLRGVLVDGSPNMLRMARERLKPYRGLSFVEADFSTLIEGWHLGREIDLIYSSMALHHLDRGEKLALLGRIYSALKGGGYFVNIDSLAAASEGIERWYQHLYREDMDRRAAELGIESMAEEVIARASKPEHRAKMLSLEQELGLLKEAGFTEVECHYKYLGFVLYSGRKPL